MKLTRAQQREIAKLYRRIKEPAVSYRQFRRSVKPLFAGQGCAVVEWQGMIIGVEPDGYAHS